MNETVESLRQLLMNWYRQGQPWPSQPTLATFRQSVKAPGEVAALLDELIARHGSDMPVQRLRLYHLLDLLSLKS